MSFFFFSSRRRHTRFDCDWSSDVCSSDLFRILYELGRVEQSFLRRAADTGPPLPGNKHVEGRKIKDRKSTRLNSSHSQISYAVFCLKKKKRMKNHDRRLVNLMVRVLLISL